MSYRFHADESVKENVVRVVRDQIDKAREELQAEDLHEGVHQARKRFKKVRAILRLVRQALGDTYDAENVWFRDAGRELSAVRDAEAMIETFDRLRDTYGGHMKKTPFKSVRQGLLDRRDRLAEKGVETRAKVDKLIAQLAEAHRRVGEWSLAEEGWDAVGPAFKKVYKRGRKAFETAYDTGADEDFHEWRKRVKYHRYQVRALRNLWRPMLNPYRKELHRLTDYLGDDHDLVVFRATLLEDPDAYGSKRDLQALLAIVERRQKELRTRSEPLARRIYFEKPGAITARFGAWWEAWKAEDNLKAMLKPKRPGD